MGESGHKPVYRYRATNTDVISPAGSEGLQRIPWLHRYSPEDSDLARDSVRAFMCYIQRSIADESPPSSATPRCSRRTSSNKSNSGRPCLACRARPSRTSASRSSRRATRTPRLARSSRPSSPRASATPFRSSSSSTSSSSASHEPRARRADRGRGGVVYSGRLPFTTHAVPASLRGYSRILKYQLLLPL